MTEIQEPFPTEEAKVEKVEAKKPASYRKVKCKCGKELTQKQYNAHLVSAVHLKAMADREREAAEAEELERKQEEKERKQEEKQKRLAEIAKLKIDDTGDKTNQVQVKKDVANKVQVSFDAITKKLDLLDAIVKRFDSIDLVLAELLDILYEEDEDALDDQNTSDEMIEQEPEPKILKEKIKKITTKQ
jgi:hypothetical protein